MYSKSAWLFMRLDTHLRKRRAQSVFDQQTIPIGTIVHPGRRCSVRVSEGTLTRGHDLSVPLIGNKGGVEWVLYS